MGDSFELPDSAPRDLWPLLPENPQDMHVLFALIREELQRPIVGHEQIVAQLALLGAMHIAQDALPSRPLSRALIIGGAEAGKTMVALRLAKVLDLPWVHIPATSVAETNWRGTDVTELIGSMYKDVVRNHPTGDTAELAERAVVIIDDIDHLRLPGRYTGSPQTHDYQAGRQRSLVPLVGDGVLPVEVGSQHIYWPSRRALVISLGRFAALEPTPSSPEHLVDWGMIPELARALCRGRVLRIPELGDVQRRRLMQGEVRSLKHAFRLCGYRLTVSDEALSDLTDHLSSVGGSDFAAARSLLHDAANRALIRLLSDGAQYRTQYVLAPDDLEPPPEAPGLWRE